MSLQLPGAEQPSFLHSPQWGISLLLVVAVSYLAAHPPLSLKARMRRTAFYALALALQMTLLRYQQLYDWNVGPIAVLVLSGGVWQCWRPETAGPADFPSPGLHRAMR